VGNEAPKVGTAGGMVHLSCVLINSPLFCVGSGAFAGAKETGTIGCNGSIVVLSFVPQGDLA